VVLSSSLSSSLLARFARCCRLDLRRLSCCCWVSRCSCPSLQRFSCSLASFAYVGLASLGVIRSSAWLPPVHVSVSASASAFLLVSVWVSYRVEMLLVVLVLSSCLVGLASVGSLGSGILLQWFSVSGSVCVYVLLVVVGVQHVSRISWRWWL